MTKLIEHQKPKTRPTPAPPKLVEVTFSLERPRAREVFVCGDFNQWSPGSLKMVWHDDKGRWQTRLALAPGRYQYKFVVDGEWIHDPGADQNVPNPSGSLNSILEVGP